jgi:GNAT superfamily N-acetyltransferase
MSKLESIPVFCIRRAVEADIPAMLPLMRSLAVFEEYIDVFAVDEGVLREQGFGRSPPDFHVLLAEAEDGALLGMLVYFLIPFTATARPTLYVKELYVAERARGAGLGEALMRAAARAAVAHGCNAIKWTVADWNEPAKRFYQRLGAREDRVWVNYGLDAAAIAALAEATTVVGSA